MYVYMYTHVGLNVYLHLYQFGLMYVYFSLWVTIQCCSYFLAQDVSTLGIGELFQVGC